MLKPLIPMVLVMTLIYPPDLSCQTSQRSKSLLPHSQLWQKIEHYLEATDPASMPIHSSPQLLLLSPDHPAPPSAVSPADIFDFAADHQKRDWGLDITANYRLGSANYDFDPEEHFTASRYYIQVGWNLLGNGWMHNDRRADALALRATKERLGSLQTEKEKYYKAKYNFVVRLFNQTSLQILHERSRALEILIAASRNRYFQHHGTEIEYLEALRKQRVTETTISGLMQFNDHLQLPEFLDTIHQQTDTRQLPIWDLALEALQDSLEIKQYDQHLADLEQDIYHTSHPWYENVTLKPYLRYQGSGGGGAIGLLPGESRVSAGVQLRVPIRRSLESRPGYQKIKWDLRQAQGQEQSNTRWNEMLSLHQEYLMLLRQTEGLAASRGIVIARLRELKVEWQYDEVIPRYRMHELLESLLEIDFELNDLKKRLYVRLLQIDRILPQHSIAHFLRMPSHEAEPANMYAIDAIQLSDRLLERYPAEFLASYLLRHNIKRAYLPPNVPADDDRIRSLATLLRRSVDLMTVYSAQHPITSTIPRSYWDFSALDTATLQQIPYAAIRAAQQATGLICTPAQQKYFHAWGLRPRSWELKVNGSLTPRPLDLIAPTPKNIRINPNGFSSLLEISTFIRSWKTKNPSAVIVLDDLDYLLDLEKAGIAKTIGR